MDQIARDVRHALRLLARQPGFAVLALATLGVGIGASTAMFAVLDQVVLRPLPFGAPDELVYINETNRDGTETYSVSLPNFFDWRERSRSFASLSAYRAANFNLSGDDGAARVRGAMVSRDFFDTLDVRTHLGTTFASDPERSVVLSYRTWSTRFGGSPDVLGKVMNLDGRSFVIAGVLRDDFEFLTSTIEIWLPLSAFEHELPWDDRGSHPALWVVGRLAPGVSLATARNDMDRVARDIDAEFDHADRVSVVPLHERSVGGSRASLTSLMAAVALLLLIACVNVANLILGVALGRTREMATRTALGAGRRRLVGQLVTEGLLLSSLGGLLGLLIGSWGIDLLKWFLPATTPRLESVAMDAGAFSFALGVSLVTGVLFSVAPATVAHGSLRARMQRRVPLGSGLVIAEMALATILLVGAGLAMKSFFHLRSVDAGFVTESRIAARFDLTPSKYGDAERAVAFYLELLDNVRALPSVRSASVSTGLPLVSPGTEAGILREGLLPEQENFVLASFQLVSTEYFETLGVRLVEGRVFDETDRLDTARVAVVDRTLAETMFAAESAVGKRFLTGSEEAPERITIVGVVEHVRTYQLSAPRYVQVYVPLEQPPGWLSRGFPPANLVVRSTSATEPMFSTIREIVGRLDPTQPVFGTTTLDGVRDRALAPDRANTILSTSFALAAMALAALGLYGALAGLVRRRTSEIGLRMALGATPPSIVASVVRNALWLVVVGGALGWLGGLAVSRMVSSLLYGVSAFDGEVWLWTAAVVLVVAALASVAPALRAVRVPALEALRVE